MLLQHIESLIAENVDARDFSLSETEDMPRKRQKTVPSGLLLDVPPERRDSMSTLAQSVDGEVGKSGNSQPKSSRAESVVEGEVGKSVASQPKSSRAESVDIEVGKSIAINQSINQSTSISGMTEGKPASQSKSMTPLGKQKLLKSPPSSYIKPSKRQQLMESLHAVESRQRKQDPTWSKCLLSL